MSLLKTPKSTNFYSIPPTSQINSSNPKTSFPKYPNSISNFQLPPYIYYLPHHQHFIIIKLLVIPQLVQVKISYP